MNRDAQELVIDAVYQGLSMESAARKLIVPPKASVPVFLRAVETTLGTVRRQADAQARAVAN